MHPLLIYIIQVNIALVMFCLLYMLLFKKDTFLNFRRFYFITAIAFSLLYPMFIVEGVSDIWAGKPEVATEVHTTVSVDFEAATAVVELSEVSDEGLTIPWKQILIGAYAAVTVFFIFRFLWQLFTILRMRWKSNLIKVSDIDVYNLKEDITPFSFFKMIFINIEKHSDHEIEQIIIHEHTHVKEKHSIDIILIELILLFSWWNPLLWLMKREVAMNLEYLADNGVLREGVDCTDYQYHLLRLTYSGSAVQIVNNFNVSQLKQRIMMMNKSRTSTLKLAKYLLVLPLFFVLIAVNSVYAGEKEEEMKEPPPVKIAETDEVFMVVDELPVFPGGQSGMMKFLGESIKYPLEAQKEGIQGRVVCGFIIEKDGSVSNVDVVRGVDPNLDAEAVRIIEAMPKWTPGKQNGEIVRTRFTLPVQFRLMGDDDVKKEEVQVKETDQSLTINASNESDGINVDNEIFVVVEDSPEFPGGMSELIKFLSDSIVYPAIALENGIQGSVVTNFVIKKDGSIDDVQIVRGVDPVLDKEAVRVVGLMPDWKPGRQRGRAVDVRYTLPIAFRLDGGPSEVSVGELKVNEIEMSVVMNVTQDMVFPGGQKEFMTYLNSSVKYPVLAQENGTQAFLNAVFTINGNGTVSGVKILDANGNEISEDTSDRSGIGALAREARRVVTSMPQWEKSSSYIASGRVLDSKSSPIMGASIIIKDTNTGTISDSNGNFQITLPSKNSKLAFSFIGYKSQEISSATLKLKSDGITKSIPMIFKLQGEDGGSTYDGPMPDNAVVIVGFGGK